MYSANVMGPRSPIARLRRRTPVALMSRKYRVPGRRDILPFRRRVRDLGESRRDRSDPAGRVRRRRARGAGDGPEVLVLERSAASRFLPSYVVFPGGAVDAGRRGAGRALVRLDGRGSARGRRARARGGSGARADRERPGPLRARPTRWTRSRRARPRPRSCASSATGSRRRMSRSGSTRGTSPCARPATSIPRPTVTRRSAPGGSHLAS